MSQRKLNKQRKGLYFPLCSIEIDFNKEESNFILKNKRTIVVYLQFC